MSHRNRRSRVVHAVAAASTMACSSASPQPCDMDFQCGTGWACVDGACARLVPGNPPGPADSSGNPDGNTDSPDSGTTPDGSLLADALPTDGLAAPDGAAPIAMCAGAAFRELIDPMFGWDTTLSTDQFAGSCGGAGAPDQLYHFVAPRTGTLLVGGIFQYSAVIYVRKGTDCRSADLACARPPFPGTQVQKGDSLWIFIDGWMGDAGMYDMTVVVNPNP